MVRNLDRSGQGIVNWKQLATFIILLKSTLPSEKELESYKRTFLDEAGPSKVLSQQTFLKVPNLILNTL